MSFYWARIRIGAFVDCHDVHSSGKLAVIENSNVQNAIAYWLNHDVVIPGNTVGIWIGLHKSNWQWNNGMAVRNSVK